MPLILRIIRQSRWIDDYKQFAWLPSGDFPSDPLGDLVTQGNTLSFYHYSNKEEDLNRIVAAIASTRQHIGKVDYALFDYAQFKKDIGFNEEKQPGNTPDELVNEWHLNVINISSSALINMAKFIYNNSTIDRYLPLKVIKYLNNSIGRGFIDIKKINDPSILVDLKRYTRQ